MAEIFEISHHSVNRFLERERYEPKDLFEENKAYINLIGGTLSGDDTVIEKLYSNVDKAELFTIHVISWRPATRLPVASRLNT